MEQFNYLIGRLWGPETHVPGALSVYMIHGAEVHYGTEEDAEFDLEYVQRQSPGNDWRIVRINTVQA